MRFLDPLRSQVEPIRWIVTAAITLFGVIILVQSYYESGQSQDWRISAGVSALAIALISLTTRLPFRRTILLYKPIEVASVVLALGGGVAILQSLSTEREWMRMVLQQGGFACLVVSAVDLLFNSLINDFKRGERQERQVWGEFTLQTGIFFNLSLWSYYWMREFLDELPAGETRSAAERTARLLRYAQKAAELPEHQKPYNNPGIMEILKRDFQVTRQVTLCAEANHLTDDEFHYLRVLAEMRTNPDWPQDELLTNENLSAWIEDAAEEIVRNRPSGWKKWISWLTPLDPLGALEEMRHYLYSRYGSTSPSPSLTRATYEK
jgi:hypothetical protein